MPEPKKQLADRMLNMRVTAAQHAAFAKAAERDGRTVSAWVRHQAVEALRRKAG